MGNVFENDKGQRFMKYGFFWCCCMVIIPEILARSRKKALISFGLGHIPSASYYASRLAGGSVNWCN